ncbi:CBS domain-containing protein [Colwellia sp. MEBiC06753]
MRFVSELMTSNVITAHLDQRLEQVKAIFEEFKFHHILVVDSNDKLCGVLSDRDLLKAISHNIGSVRETAKDIATLNKRVHQVANRNPIALKSSANLAQAVKIFHEFRVTCIPIVNDENEPVGIITTKDIIKYLYDKIQPAS